MEQQKRHKIINCSLQNQNNKYLLLQQEESPCDQQHGIQQKVKIIVMYNYQKYMKENKLQKKFDLIRKQYYQTISHKQKTSPSLIHSHKKRIEGFILAMIEKPNPVTPYRDTHYEPRSPEKSHSIHEKSFHLNHLTEKDRLEEIKEKHSVFDAVPFNNTFSHRFKDFKNQHTLKPMRYKSVNAALRIKEELEATTLNYLPNLKNKKIDKLARNTHISWKDKEYVKQVNKSLLPMMHKKSYFQSLKSIFAQSPHGFMKSQLKNQKYQKDTHLSKLDDYDEETDLDMNSKKQKKNTGENMNRKENSRQALMKCGLLGGKGTAYIIGMEKTSKRVFPLSHLNQTTDVIRG